MKYRAYICLDISEMFQSVAAFIVVTLFFNTTMIQFYLWAEMA